MPDPDSLQIKPLTAALGARVSGVDLSTSLPASAITRIKAALADHLVLFFDKQTLDAPGLRAAAKQFGSPVEYPFVSGVQGYPEVIEVIKRPEETVNFGGVWHTDSPYLETPAMGALLYAQEVPANGGDTLFANMYAAYDALSDGLKALLQSLSAHHAADKSAIASSRQYRQDRGTDQRLEAVHPVVRTHPESRRKLLYVSTAHTTRFDGWSIAESRELLNYLFEHQRNPAFQCRYSWQAGDVAFWDNRACQHYPLNDYNGQWRRMLRVSLAGDKPV